MEFGVFDHLDKNDRPLARYYAERLELIATYERAGFSAWRLRRACSSPRLSSSVPSWIKRPLLLVCAAAAALPTFAQDPAAAYPKRPIRVVIGYSAGGGSDIVPRLVLERVAAKWGQPFLVLLGADSLIIAGTTTSGCVRATVVDAFSNNYRVAIVEEGCFDRSQASHALSLCDMNAKYADVVGLEETLAYIEALPKGLFNLPAGGAAGLRKVG